VRAAVGEKIKSPYGQDLLARWQPGIFSRFEAETSARAVLEVAAAKQGGLPGLPISDLPDVRAPLKRISRQGRITVEEFGALLRFQRASAGLELYLNRLREQARALRTWLAGLDPLEAWGKRHAPLLDAQGQIADSASEDLRALRAYSKDLAAKIEARLEDYLHNPKSRELLQDSYITIRDGRFVLPIKTNFKGRVPGIIHDISNSEQTLFIEPQEVVEWNNQLKVVEKEIEEEIERILAEVVSRTEPLAEQFSVNAHVFARADLCAGLEEVTAEWSKHRVAAAWRDDADLRFGLVSHPLLGLAREVVPSSLSWKQGIVLTGPNTGGKTVLLKTIGLGVCLAWAGAPVPAQDAVIPTNLGGLFADIGDDQDLSMNLSTFSGHLAVLKEMIEESRAGDLVLLDEIATGTSPEEGQPLAQAVIESLLERGARLLVTTHYANLKHFAMTDERLRIAAMGFEIRRSKPTYEIHLDIPGESSAFDTAAQLGLPSAVIQRARALRGEVNEDLSVAVKRLEEARRRFQDRENELEDALEKAKAREASAQARVLEYEAKQRAGLSEESKEILRSFSALREELSQAVRRASSEELKAGGLNLFQKVAEGAEKVRSAAGEIERATPSTVPLAGDDIHPDAVVHVEGLGLGTVLEVPPQMNDRSLVLVQVGEIKSRVARSRLKRANHEQIRGLQASKSALQVRDRKIQTGGAPLTPAGKGSSSFICDVRGQRVEEAMRKVVTALNELARDDGAVVTIVHGHGSERLKDTIRTYLAKERGDLQYRSGQWPGEGGDGVTLVERAR